MKTITFNACKGGTGKSTLSILTLNALTKQGSRVLAMDCDMINHSLSYYCNDNLNLETIQRKNVFKVFTGEAIADNVLKINEHLDLLHADVRLADFRGIETRKRLENAVRGIKDSYDYLIIDTAPTWDNIIVNILAVTDQLVIPANLSIFDYQSCKYLLNKLYELEFEDLDVSIIFNKFKQPRSNNADTFSNQIINLFKTDKIIGPYISENHISASSTIEKYIADKSFRISAEKASTAKTYKEIAAAINEITGEKFKEKTI